MTNSGLNVSNLSVEINGKKILDNISFECCKGEIVGLFGNSGCGKSTTLKAIAGLIDYQLPKRVAKDEPNSIISFDGMPLDNLLPNKRNTVIVFQDLRLFPNMTVQENIVFPLQLKKVPKKIRNNKASNLLEQVQLAGFEKRRIKELSGGQMQRVALARALAASPNALLLDEPFTGLDEELRLSMRELVKKIQKESSFTLILVSHDKGDVVDMCNRVALMKNGKITKFDTCKNIWPEYF